MNFDDYMSIYERDPQLRWKLDHVPETMEMIASNDADGNPAGSGLDRQHSQNLSPVLDNKSKSDSNTDASSVTQNLGGRIANIESKFNRFESLFDEKDLKLEAEDDPGEDSDRDETGKYFDVHRLTARYHLQSVLWFLARSRNEFNRATKARQRRDAKKKETKANGVTIDNVKHESLEELSTTAFLKNEAAEVSWSAWTQFVRSRGPYENSAMSPLIAVIDDPEPQIMLQLKDAASASGTSSKKPPTIRQSERPPKALSDVLGQSALPERIKIHSGPLYHILRAIVEARKLWPVSSEDGSIVFLRPFREFVYYEKELRSYLAQIEKQSEEWKRTDNSLTTSTDTVVEASEVQKTEADMKSDADSGQPSTTPRREEESATHHDNVESGHPKKDEQISPNPVTDLMHTRCLVRFMDDEITPKLTYVNGEKCDKILFHDLWHLFKPGKEVIDQKEKQAYRIVRVEIPRHKVEDPWARWTYRKLGKQEEEEDKADEDIPVKVHCAYVDFDGKQFGPVSVTFTIQPYGALKDIKSLPVYPLRFAKDTNFRGKLIKRGKMLLDVAKFRPMYYSGYTLDSRDEIDSQVVVDFSEALANEARRKWTPKIDNLRTAPDNNNNNDECAAACCSGQAVGNDEYIDSRLTEDFVKSLIPDHSLRAPSLLLSPRLMEETQAGSEDEPTDDEYVVMTYRVFAFVLRSRKWAQLDLTFLRYQNSDARSFTLSAFDQLALPDGHRDMVKSLVTQHFRDRQSTSNEQTDLIKGKGKGLILLLHGAPGVGKTTTAEGVAELFQKPLFQITCGDLGNTARDVEGELEKNFALASRWGCILLLDEADVFLSARERKDFERNGLVAVFLRVLEYYAGILFLTTNRIGDFDEAFASRIHMSLYYPELDETKTKKVFTLNLDLIQQRFNRQNRKITYDASSIESFAGHHFQNHRKNRWNGRQIRNLCQTALALAEFDAHGREIDGKVKTDATVQLQLKYFESVQKAYLEFGRYLGDVRGTEGDQRAYDNALRAREGTPFQTTPSRFSAKGDEPRQFGRHEPSLSQSQSSVHGDQFQPIGGGNYAPGASPNMRPVHGQYYPSVQGFAGSPASAGYESHQNYSPFGVQQAQSNSSLYPVQHPSQAGFNQQVQQSWGASNTPMAYTSAGQPSIMQQPQGHSFQGQNLQGQNLQSSPYGYANVTGVQQNDTMGGASLPSQVFQGGPVGPQGPGGKASGGSS